MRFPFGSYVRQRQIIGAVVADGAYRRVFFSQNLWVLQPEDIEQVFLGINDGDVFRSTVSRMLPDHAGGTFEGISLGSRTFARQVADPPSPVYSIGGIDVILSSALWSSDKDAGETAAYDLGGFGFEPFPLLCPRLRCRCS